MNKIRLLLPVGAVLAFLSGFALWGVSLSVASNAIDVYQLTPADPKTVEVNRGLFELDPPDRNALNYPRKVMDIYGIPGNEPEKLLFVDPAKLVRPRELPSIAFLPVDKNKGENPLQAKTVLFFGKLARGGAFVAASFLAVAALLAWAAAPAPGGRHASAD